MDAPLFQMGVFDTTSSRNNYHNKRTTIEISHTPGFFKEDKAEFSNMYTVEGLLDDLGISLTVFEQLVTMLSIQLKNLHRIGFINDPGQCRLIVHEWIPC